MNGFDSNDPRDEALWDLLGRARRVKPSPYFARKVRLALEAEPAARPAWWAFCLRALAPVAICAGLVAVAFVGIQRDAEVGATARNEAEFETIQNLDLLVSNYESSLWLDHSSSY
jgi:hypothetical protein